MGCHLHPRERGKLENPGGKAKMVSLAIYTILFYQTVLAHRKAVTESGGGNRKGSVRK